MSKLQKAEEVFYRFTLAYTIVFMGGLLTEAFLYYPDFPQERLFVFGAIVEAVFLFVYGVFWALDVQRRRSIHA